MPDHYFLLEHLPDLGGPSRLWLYGDEASALARLGNLLLEWLETWAVHDRTVHAEGRAMVEAITAGNVPLPYSLWCGWLEASAGPQYGELFTLMGGWPWRRPHACTRAAWSAW
jgi:hypothetical protein